MLVACEAAMLSQFAPQTERKPGALGSSGIGLDWRVPFDPLAWKALTFRWKVGLAGTSLMGAFLAIGAASYAVVPAGSANVTWLWRERAGAMGLAIPTALPARSEVMFIELLGALGQIGAGSELQQVMASLTRSPSCKRGRWIFALVFPAFLCWPLGFLLSCSCH